MEGEFKCPVCGKSGIEDYLNQDVVCPCCGTDLTVYRLVNQIGDASENAHCASTSKRWSRNLIFGLLAVSLCIALGCVVASLARQNRSFESENMSLSEQASALEAKIDSLSSIKAEPAVQHFQYTVRPGDSFWRISTKLYGSGSKAADIASMNGLALDSPLHKGQILIIE